MNEHRQEQRAYAQGKRWERDYPEELVWIFTQDALKATRSPAKRRVYQEWLDSHQAPEIFRAAKGVVISKPGVHLRMVQFSGPNPGEELTHKEDSISYNPGKAAIKVVLDGKDIPTTERIIYAGDLNRLNPEDCVLKGGEGFTVKNPGIADREYIEESTLTWLKDRFPAPQGWRGVKKDASED